MNRPLETRYSEQTKLTIDALYRATAAYVGAIHVAAIGPGEQLDLEHVYRRQLAACDYDDATRIAADLYDQVWRWPQLLGLARNISSAMAAADNLVGDALKNASK